MPALPSREVSANSKDVIMAVLSPPEQTKFIAASDLGAHAPGWKLSIREILFAFVHTNSVKRLLVWFSIIQAYVIDIGKDEQCINLQK